jgi:magnesium chelatase subunit I
LFVQYFPNPEQTKKKKRKNSEEEQLPLDPYQTIVEWFNNGQHLDLLLDMKDADKILALKKVNGLDSFVKKHFHMANQAEQSLLMEFVLHGLAAYSLISKKNIDGKIAFQDLMGGIMNFGSLQTDEWDQEE